MKRILFALSLITLAFCLFSCNKTKPDTKNGDTPKKPDVKKETVFKLDKTDLTFKSEGGKETIKLTSTKDWKATTDADWIKIDPASAKGSDSEVSINITVDNNTTGEMRKGEIKILDKKISVSQEAVAPTILLHTNQAKGAAVTLQMYSSIDKTAKVDWGDGSPVETLSLEPVADTVKIPGTDVVVKIITKEEKAKKYKGPIVKHVMLKKGADIKIYAPGMEGFKAPASWLTSIDVTNAKELKLVSFERNNDVTKMDFSNQTKLVSVYVWGNSGLKDLVLNSNLPNLRTIECYHTAIKNLDVSNYPALQELSCENNPGLQLKFSDKNTSFTKIWLYNNKYDSATLNNIFKMLPKISGRNPIIYPTTTKNPTNVNDLNGVDFSLATSKGWNVVEHGTNKVLAQP